MRFRPLQRDYWPARVRQPFARLALAAALTPTFAAIAVAVAVYLVYAIAPHTRDWPFQDPLAFFFEVAVELYFFAIVAVGPIFLLLWSMRLRSQSAYVFGAMLGGAIGAGASSLRFEPVTAIEFMIAIALSVVLALALRALAGVRQVL